MAQVFGFLYPYETRMGLQAPDVGLILLWAILQRSSEDGGLVPLMALWPWPHLEVLILLHETLIGQDLVDGDPLAAHSTQACGGRGQVDGASSPSADRWTQGGGWEEAGKCNSGQVRPLRLGRWHFLFQGRPRPLN